MAYLAKFDPTLNDWRTTNTMNTKHTPGPWEATTMDDMNQCGLGVSAKNPAGMRVNVANVVFNGHNLPTEANARLIAAAPDLLEALQMLSETAGRVAQGAPVVDERGLNTLSHSISAALAAIDKATK